MPDDSHDSNPPVFGFQVDVVRVERLQRHLMRLAGSQPELAGDQPMQEMWVAVALAVAAGFAHMQVHCNGRDSAGNCPQCRGISSANQLGMLLGQQVRAEADGLAQAKREGRVH